MSIQYFYNFCLKGQDNTDLSGDLLSGIRRSYFNSFERIKDKLTGNSEAEPYFYDFSIEKEKPMKWLVKDAEGKTVQEVLLSDNGKYYIYFYEGQALFKRLLFSKHHTLLKAEYFDTATGVVRHTLEPRKAQTGLCILYTVKTSPVPIPLFEAPEVYNARIAKRIDEEFDDYTVTASTDEGIVRFLSDEQLARFNAFKEKCEQELAEEKEETFVGEDTPLLNKINAKDFNVKRNLSASLDITRAMEFGVQESAEAAPEPVILDEVTEPEEITEAVSTVEEPVAEVPETEEESDIEKVPEVGKASEIKEEPEVRTEPEEEKSHKPKPDKLIMADGAVYSYYGTLDAQGNRSGYGRTLTELGRTAYEGLYFNDKRSGYGSYFYKDGSLCYSGDWLENARHGVGVGVSSRDGSIHVGGWKNNKPEGNGVRLSADGDIKFVCKELSDGTTLLMNYMPDDTVIVSKYDENGKKVGETTQSLKDLPF